MSLEVGWDRRFGGWLAARRRRESIIESMVIHMNEAQVRTLEQVRQVLAGTQALEFQGLEHQPVDVQSGQRVRRAWHIQNVNAYHGRFKEWMRRFKAVATSYLPNYLGGFRALDRNARSAAKPASLLALAVGT